MKKYIVWEQVSLPLTTLWKPHEFDTKEELSEFILAEHDGQVVPTENLGATNWG